jgi:N-acetylglucosaminyl-diphospho-decaprenol L-rhamnosyltransferase
VKVIVVTVNYGAARHVLNMLDALMPQIASIEGGAEAWVVDNQSPDDSVQVLRVELAKRNYQSRVRCIESPVNGGFGAGNNIAIRQALALPSPPEFIHLMNPDAVPSPHCVQTQLEFLEKHPAVGLVGGELRGVDGSLFVTAFRYPTALAEFERYAGLGVVSRVLQSHRIAFGQLDQACPVDWVSGANMMIRRSAIERVGLFDENFFLYFEEVDLCRRMKAAGFPVYFVPNASVTHLSGATTGVGDPRRRLPKYWFQSRCHYYRKAAGDVGLFAANAAAVCGLTIRRLREFVSRSDCYSPGLLRDLLRYSALPLQASCAASAHQQERI